MARTGKRKVTKDPTKEARIKAAIRDTLTGIFDSFRSAAIAHNVCAPSAAFDADYISFRYPHRLYETVLLGNTAPDSHYSAKRRKLFWWTGVTITQTQQPLSILAHSVVECLGLSVSTLVNNGSAALFLVTPILSTRIKGHLEDPETCVVLANNSRFSALYGSKRRVRITIPATSEGSSHSTPVASTSTTNDPSHKCRLSRKLKNISPFRIQTIRQIIIPDPRPSTLHSMHRILVHQIHCSPSQWCLAV